MPVIDGSVVVVGVDRVVVVGAEGGRVVERGRFRRKLRRYRVGTHHLRIIGSHKFTHLLVARRGLDCSLAHVLCFISGSYPALVIDKRTDGHRQGPGVIELEPIGLDWKSVTTSQTYDRNTLG